MGQGRGFPNVNIGPVRMDWLYAFDSNRAQTLPRNHRCATTRQWGSVPEFLSVMSSNEACTESFMHIQVRQKPAISHLFPITLYGKKVRVKRWEGFIWKSSAGIVQTP
ncbi:hypothetical protein AVEN_116058-1 [Araneus ventricosus]|uniref:Uncharacterized protein n=1 Tax=Araneus ventricosus TaxID=182803 RepID=A0A4Y2BID0_ARAVE|nr:hypothetical protein AVEN_116058-1 [Araneus ventricosus]